MGITPTTKAQVSGHRFLWRRVEHGLVLGDVRMIHDPLSKRRRALLFGVAAAVLISLGSAALAVFKPAVDPGQAQVIRAESGQLYVRVDNQIYPVANLSSARLIVQEPVQPVKGGDAVLHKIPKAAPVGIADAPALFEKPGKSPKVLRSFACHLVKAPETRLDPRLDDVTVVVAEESFAHVGLKEMNPKQALLAQVGQRQYVVTQQGRRKLPDENSPEGRIVRRVLGIGPSTPRWFVRDELLDAVIAQPDLRFPQVDEVIRSSGRVFALKGGQLFPITDAQARLLEAMGVRARMQTPLHIADIQDGPEEVFHLPVEIPDFIQPEVFVPCIDSAGKVQLFEHKADKKQPQHVEQSAAPAQTQDTPSSGPPHATPMVADEHPLSFFGEPVRISGKSIARQFVGPGVAFAADTGSGIHIVGASGLRHRLETPETKDHVGLSQVHPVSWDILRLLPEGSELGRTAALQPLVPEVSTSP
ncbi:MAG: type VII secretion protein EccB [Corynebacterium sp.]|uniref:type VII secretion protein EccB n=1 Tax=Corynebacterium sp. TaxID=1720 RepID=UPI0026DD021F|nr:type VII secretion protein EccB [Corynebacterium sp.]MDO4760821.1 type VII secretion protein EccB [Corynebacterium sp.]